MDVYAPAEPMLDADAATGFQELRAMMDKWSNESLACYCNVENNLPLVINQTQYTIGPGGDLNVRRPIALNEGTGAAYLMDSNQVIYPVDVIQQDLWNLIGLRTITSTLPDTIFYDPQYPLGILNVFPQPLAQYNLFFDSRLQLQELTSLSTVFSLPPGYENAIVPNLAIKMWGTYCSKRGEIPRWLKDEAGEALASVKRSNIKISPSRYDLAIISRAKSPYNIFSDSWGSRNAG
jgi:hypothetical protein